jgi:DNA anti-recombination protein RmuC
MSSLSLAKNYTRGYRRALLGMSNDVESLKVLDANLGHVQRDVAEIKSDQRDGNKKLDQVISDLHKSIDGVNRRMDTQFEGVNKRIDSQFEGTNKRVDAQFEAVHKRIDTQFEAINKRIDTQFEGVHKRIDTEISKVANEIGVIRADFTQKFDAMRGEIFAVKSSVEAAKVWTLTLLLGVAASLLGVMAHGFKWL